MSKAISVYIYGDRVQVKAHVKLVLVHKEIGELLEPLLGTIVDSDLVSWPIGKTVQDMVYSVKLDNDNLIRCTKNALEHVSE